MFLLLTRRVLHACQRPHPTAYYFCGHYTSNDRIRFNNKVEPISGTIERYIHTSASKCKKDSFQNYVNEALTVLKTVELKEVKSAPLPAILYGFGGIVPFVFPPLYFIMNSFSPFLATAQIMYGATILAFIGGVKWGNAVAKSDISHEQIGFSTIPSLVAWSALLVPEPVGCLILSSGLVWALYLDLKSSGYPQWFNAIRACLTGIAATSLMTTFICHLF